MSQQAQQSHEWQFWIGSAVLLMAIRLAFEIDVLQVRIAFAVVALFGFVLATRAVALDAGKKLDTWSQADWILSQAQTASPEDLAQALSWKRVDLRSGTQSLRQRGPFLLIIAFLMGVSWFTAGVFAVVLIWELLRIRRELNALDQLEMAMAVANSTSGTST